MPTPREAPEWAHRPAVVRLAVTKPALLAPFAETNRRKAYGDQIKPFNFIQAVMVQPRGHPTGVDQQRFHLIGPFTKDATRWLRMRWIDRYTGKRYGISTRPTGGEAASTVAAVKSYSDVIDEYGFHPETKSADADGAQCRRDTVGLLQRRPVYASQVVPIGKESNALDDVEAGIVADWDEVRNVYRDPAKNLWRSATAILSTIPLAEAAARTGLSESAISRIRRHRQRPRWRTQAVLVRIAAELARVAAPDSIPANDVAACAAYCVPSANIRGPLQTCANCARPLVTKRAQYCSSRCRLRAFRRRRDL